MTQVSTVDGTTTYAIAANSNQLNSRSLVPEDSDFDTMSYTYGAEGKLTQRSEGTDSDAFTYGFGSQLKQIIKTRNNTVTRTLDYAYDGGGKRVKVTDSDGTRFFLYDGTMPVLELDSNKNIAVSYLYGADGAVYRRMPVAAAHWHFDEGNGTVLYDIDGRNNGTLGGGDANKAPAWSTEGGGSLLFDGTNDLVKVDDSDALDLVTDTLTISCWVKRSSATSGNLVKKADASNGYRLWITADGNLQFEVLIAGTKTIATSVAPIPLNTWQHVAAWYNGTQIRVYVGRVIMGGENVKGALTGTTEPLYMGYHDGTNHHLHGYLDDVSIYARALSQTEVEELIDNSVGRYEHHHTNALGSNIVLTDEGKNVVARYEYDVFGAVRSETGTSDNPRKFTGKEYESDVKLYYYDARYYDPYAGRFITRDPIRDGINWYAYTNNNPLKYTDPDGLEPVQSGVTTVKKFVEHLGDNKPKQLSAYKPTLGFRKLVIPTPKYIQFSDYEHSRYIATEQYGWIDMQHFMAAAAEAHYHLKNKTPDEAHNKALNKGFMSEKFQEVGSPNSAWSYEDLPSNMAGADFGAYHYDPDGGVTGRPSW